MSPTNSVRTIARTIINCDEPKFVCRLIENRLGGVGQNDESFTVEVVPLGEALNPAAKPNGTIKFSWRCADLMDSGVRPVAWLLDTGNFAVQTTGFETDDVFVMVANCMKAINDAFDVDEHEWATDCFDDEDGEVAIAFPY